MQADHQSLEQSLEWTEEKKPFRKEVFVGWISSSVEAYNMALYNFSAPLLAPLLFQGIDPAQALFLSYFLSFLGFCFFYPAGAIYYGLMGDRYGRRTVCISSTLGLSLSTGLMGLMMESGWVFFSVLIGAQYFFSGGEYHGSVVFSLEHGEKKHEGLMSALSCLFAVFGLALASGLSALSFLMQDIFWTKVCFFAGAAFGFLSYVLKKYCKETPPFSLSEKPLKEMKLSTFVKEEYQNIARVVSLLAFFMVSYSFIFIFLPLMDFKASIEEFSTFKSLIFYGLFLILSGMLADRIGLQRCLRLGMILFSFAIIPCIYFCENLFTLQLVLSFLACFVIGPIHAILLHQFDVSKRCRGIFTGSAIAMAIFGGSTLPICLAIFEASHSLVISGLYPLLIAGLSFIHLKYNDIRGLKRRSLDSE